MTSPGFYICVSSEVKTDVFDIWEYFLVYGLVQSSYSRSVLPLLAPVPPCLISDLFTQILLVLSFFSFEEIVVKKNDIQEKLGRKRQGRSLSTRMKSTSARMKTKLISVTWMPEIRHLSSASEEFIIISVSSLCFWRLAFSIKSWVLGLGLARTSTTTTKETRK